MCICMVTVHLLVTSLRCWDLSKSVMIFDITLSLCDHPIQLCLIHLKYLESLFRTLLQQSLCLYVSFQIHCTMQQSNNLQTGVREIKLNFTCAVLSNILQTCDLRSFPN